MLWHRTESWESNYTFTRLRTVKCDHSLQPTDCSTLNYSHLLSWDPLKEKQLCRQKHVKNMELKEDFVAVTRDLEFWRDGGRKDRTLVGASFSMECLLCGAIRLSGWGVEDIGRNCGGTGEKEKWRAKIELKNHQQVNDMFLLDCKYKVLDISWWFLLFLPMMDSGDVSSTSEVDMLELLSDFWVFWSSWSKKKRLLLTIKFRLSPMGLA